VRAKLIVQARRRERHGIAAGGGETSEPRAGIRSGGRGPKLAKSLAGGIQAWFPKLTNPGKRFGIGVAVGLAKREGGAAELRCTTLEEAFQRPGMRPKTTLLAKADAKRVAAVFAGLAHPDRFRVASAIMTGSNSHRLLKQALGLKTGPLYHHVRGLRLAGLVTQASRNFYTLTELGEAALLIATGLGATSNESMLNWRTLTVNFKSPSKRGIRRAK
jgi:hypothetical protein